MGTTNEQLLTRAQVAERLQVCEATVRRLTDRGQLRYTRVGREQRFKPEWVEAFIERRDLRVVWKQRPTNDPPTTQFRPESTKTG